MGASLEGGFINGTHVTQQVELKCVTEASGREELHLHQLDQSTPAPHPRAHHPPSAHLLWPVIAQIPVAPASDVSFGPEDKSRAQEPGSSGREACWPAAGEKRKPEQFLALSQSKALRNLARNIVQSAPEGMA